MNEPTKAARGASGSAQNFADDFITLQDAAKEFGIYPSVVRSWLREGRLPAGSVDNFRVSRSALLTVLAANEKAAAASAAAPTAQPADGELALARRVLEVCASPTPDNLNALEHEARAILERRE